MEANAHPFCRDQHDIVVTGGESGFNERIARDNLDGNDAASSHIGEVTERRLFDRAGARGEEDAPILFPGEIFLVIAIHSFHSDDVCNFFAMLQLQHIGDTAPFGGSAEVGDLMHTLDVNSAGVREEQDISELEQGFLSAYSGSAKMNVDMANADLSGKDLGASGAIIVAGFLPKCK